MMQHVYPVDDLYEHNLEGTDCTCNPFVDLENELVIHYAFDGRDLIAALEGSSVIELPNGDYIGGIGA